MNVPALSERTLRRDIEKGDISIGSEIQVPTLHFSVFLGYSTNKYCLLCISVSMQTVLMQVNMLRSAHESDPSALWWIKGDGVDVVKGLKVSTHDQWSGDADVGDGTLLSLCRNYDERMRAATSVGLGDCATDAFIEVDLNSILHDLKDDLTFLRSGLLL